MIALFLSSSLSLFLFAIFGISLSKITKLQTNLAEKILIGLVVSNMITTILSLFVPINIYILIGLVLSCLILIPFIREEIKSLFSLIRSKKTVILFALPFILIASIISISSPFNYDTGLYYFQFIQWIENFAVVPGLANLHGRFGFNPNIFTFFALSSLFEIFKQEIFSVNFTLFSVFVLYFINKLKVLFKAEGFSNIFVFNIIIFISILNLSRNLSSPSPDFISISFPLFILSSFFKQSNLNENNGLKQYLPILILCFYVLTVKLATLPIMLIPLFILFKFRLELLKLVWLPLFLSLIILPWLVRNIILTGWIVYPFPLVDLFNFDWKVPVSNVIIEKISVTGWARSPGEHYLDAGDMSISEWFLPWWRNLIGINKLLFLTSIISPLFAFIAWLIKKYKPDFHSTTIIFTSFTGVIFWFLLAPDFRFGKAFIIIAAISPLLYLKFKLKPYWARYYDPIVLFYSTIFILAIYFARISTGFNVMQIAEENINRIVTPQIIEIPQNVHFKTFKISGIDVYVPTEGDQCFNYHLPCTPYPDSTLVLRNNTLQSGFKHNSSSTRTNHLNYGKN